MINVYITNISIVRNLLVESLKKSKVIFFKLLDRYKITPIRKKVCFYRKKIKEKCFTIIIMHA
jgi:hypothetical protein